jgi:hypothetical protein
MDLRDTLIPTYTQLLGSLAGWLRKAQQLMPGAEGEALLAARLAPDMFPLSTQVRFACRQSLEGLHRLKHEEFPPAVDQLLDEGRLGAERPGTIDAALARISETMATLEQDGGAIDIDPKSKLAHTLPNGMTFDFTAEQYVRDWALPQFYFHLMTAYTILRAQGIELGKADYVSHLFGFIRPETTG